MKKRKNGATDAVAYNRALDNRQITATKDLLLSLQDIGLTIADTTKIAREHIYKGRLPAKAGEMSLDEMSAVATPVPMSKKAVQDMYMAISNILETKYSLLINDILPEDFRSDAQSNLDKKLAEIPKGSGGTAELPDEPKRQYELAKYIASMTDEVELLKERVPYYREYIAIKQMERADTTPDDNKLALSKNKAATLAEEARKLYDLREAYNYVDEGIS